MIRHRVTKFKSPEIALKEIERFVRNGEHLRTGKPLPRFGGARSRELLGNWLLCAVLNSDLGEDRYLFTSDPMGGDGAICDSSTNQSWLIEHVMVPPDRISSTAPVEEKILEKIAGKVAKGPAYATGKSLVVFLDNAGGPWLPNRVARALPDPLLFADAWVFGLQRIEGEAYVYAVTYLDLSGGLAPCWNITIDPGFQSWAVARIQ